MRSRKRAPAPPIFFPDVTTKELVSEDEARSLYKIFFSGAQLFVPLFDATYDTYDDLRVRTPFTFNGLLAIAAKIRAGPNPAGETFRVCLAEAQGIARSTLFGPIVQKESVPPAARSGLDLQLCADVLPPLLPNPQGRPGHPAPRHAQPERLLAVRTCAPGRARLWPAPSAREARAGPRGRPHRSRGTRARRFEPHLAVPVLVRRAPPSRFLTSRRMP